MTREKEKMLENKDAEQILKVISNYTDRLFTIRSFIDEEPNKALKFYDQMSDDLKQQLGNEKAKAALNLIEINDLLNFSIR